MKSILFLLTFTMLICCTKNDNPTSSDSIVPDSTDTDSTVTDIDGNIYLTVQIGDQLWMAENLKVTHYRNGDQIPNVTDGTEWLSTKSGAYCNYHNNINNVETHGRLYNWYAVNDARLIAPKGWHVPTDDEWKILEQFLGMQDWISDFEGWRGETEGGKLKESGTAHWKDPNAGATNESGFKALPAGYRNGVPEYYDHFSYMGEFTGFWAINNHYGLGGYFRSLDYFNSQIRRDYWDERTGFSVRCIKN